MSELLFESATTLAEKVRSGEVSSRELVEESLSRIDQLNPTLNAFMALDADNALAVADAIAPGDERPFAGVPIAIKDIGIALAGLPYTAGSQLFGDFTPDFDSTATRRFKDAGFVIVGKTNTPEMGIVPVTESRRYGPVRNPWNTGHTPGGSSGGAGAAVASGMLPIAHCSDGGGSIRIPAACCGLFGMKPSRNRISYAPQLGESFLTTEGVMTRTVEDSARALDVLAGYETGDINWAPPPSAPFAASVGRDPGKLKIGVAVKPPFETEVDPVALQAVEETAALLESLGHETAEAAMMPEGVDVLPVFTALWAVQVSMLIEYGAMVGGQQPTEEILEPLTWELYQRGKGMSAMDAARTTVTLQAIARMMVSTMAPFDVILTPALAQRPVEIGAINPCSDNPMADFGKAAKFTPYTAGINLTGQPAASVPCGIADDGLPLAIQLIGRPTDEETLFALSAQLEQARPWAHLRPEVVAA